MHIHARYLPWSDRAGRLSRLKLATFVGLVSPALWMAVEVCGGALQPNPIGEAIHQSGTWAVRFMLLSLSVTPLRRIGPWGKLIAVRRMIGVAAFCYAGLHLALYVTDQHFRIASIVGEIISRFYLTIGFVTLLGLALLTATSTDGMIRRIGGKRWQTLHKSVYIISVLALLHFMLQAKLDITQPSIMLGLFLILMGWRVLQSRGLGHSAPALVGLAAASSVGTAVAEASWYHVLNHLSVADVLWANLSVDDGLRPAALVMLVGLSVAALRAACVLLRSERQPWSHTRWTVWWPSTLHK